MGKLAGTSDHGRVVRGQRQRRQQDLDSQGLAENLHPAAQQGVGGNPTGGRDELRPMLGDQRRGRPEQLIHHRELERGQEIQDLRRRVVDVRHP